MSSDKVQILVVDDDISHCTILQALLRGWGYQVGVAHNGLQALEQIHQQVFDLVLCDIRMAEMDGIATLKEIKAYNPAIPVLIMTAFSSVGTAVEAIKSGALDYLVKPLDFDTLQQTLVQALAHTRQSESDPSVATDSRWGMIGDSPAMQALLNDITLVAPSDATVLIYGESGTGKELVAKAIHEASPRAVNPLVYLNCAALPESVAESELFGHVKGAFTGAISNRSGKFEMADNGTLFLDEIGELSLALQAKLLRVLQYGDIQRVGDDRSLRVDVRVLAATNRDLREEVLAGRFRADLFHRLSVFPLSVPPLRERGDDVILLAGYFCEQCRLRLGLSRVVLSAGARNLLQHYRFPGNVRELEHAIHRAVVLARATRNGDEVILEAQHFAFPEVTLPPPEAAAVPVVKQNLREATEAFQRETIRQALAQNHHNWAACARMLETDVANLHRLAKRLGMKD